MFHLRVVAMNVTILMSMVKKPNGSIVAKGGIEFFLLQTLSEKIPFSYTLLTRNDYVFGDLIDSTGKWTGMIGMLHRDEADIALGWISATYTRQSVVDFSFPYLIDNNIFITASPKTINDNYTFLYPFQYQVWILLISSIPISALATSIAKGCSLVVRRKHESFTKICMKEILNFFALLLNQGSFKYYKESSTRLFMYLWTVAKLVLGFSYSCTLLSFLINPLRETPLRSVHELRDAVVSGQYQFGTFGGTSHLANLMDVHHGILKDLADHVRQHPENIFLTFEGAMERVKKEKLAVQNMKLHFLLTASGIGLHNFYIPQDAIGFNLVCIALKKNSPIKEKVDMVIYRIVESGLYTKKLQDLLFYAKLKGPPPEPADTYRPLSLFDVDMLFLVLATGMLLATCCLLFEIVHNKCLKFF